jgi:hypothetical protein
MIKYLNTLLILCLLSCVSTNYVTISGIVNGIEVRKKILKNTIELQIGAFQTKVSKIEGLERLSSLKKVKFLSYDFDESPFIRNLPNIEELIFDFGRLNDLNIISKLTNLKILFISGLRTDKNEIDLVNNKKLKYVEFCNIFFEPDKKYNGINPDRESLGLGEGGFVLNIINIPDSLEFLDISRSNSYLFNEDFFNTLIKITTVVVSKKVYKAFESYFKDHPNFTCKDIVELLPEIFWYKNIKKWQEKDEYRFP